MELSLTKNCKQTSVTFAGSLLWLPSLPGATETRCLGTRAATVADAKAPKKRSSLAALLERLKGNYFSLVLLLKL